MDVILEPTYVELEHWDHILNALESGSAAERVEAESELRRSGVGAVHVLYQLIGAKSEPVQERTACLLAGAGDAILEPLGPLASASDPDGSRWAASALGKLKDERALPALTRALFVGNPAAGEAIPGFGEAGAASICAYVHGLGSDDAGEELDRICSPRDSTASHPSPDMWEVLIRIGEPAATPLTALLRHDHEGVVRAASEALLRIGGSACEALLTTLSDSSIKERPTILRAFRSHPGPWMVIPLCRLLGDSDSDVDLTASCILQDLDEEILRSATAEAEAGPLVPHLCQVLCDDEEALSPPLSSPMPAFGAREVAISSRRSAAAAVLQHFPVEVIRAEMEREIDPALCHRLISVMSCGLESIAEAAFSVMWALGSLAADQIVQSLRYEPESSPGFRQRSDSQTIVLLRLLAVSGDPRATEVLCESLSPASSQFRGLDYYHSVIKVLGQMRDARAIQLLTGYLQSEIRTLRLAAVESLGQIGHRSALPALKRLLSFGLTWGDPSVNGNWVERFLTSQVLTYEPDPEVRAAVRQAISLIEQTSPEIANRPIPAIPPNDPGNSSLPRPVE